MMLITTTAIRQKVGLYDTKKKNKIICKYLVGICQNVDIDYYNNIRLWYYKRYT